MQRGKHSPPAGRYLIGILTGLLLSLGATAYAQEDTDADDSYQASGPLTGQHPASPDSAKVNAGPVRMLRFTLVQGDVTWRADSSLEWAKASINLPLRQGAQVFVPTQGRAELQFDDGSFVRLGAGALVTFQNLYSDADGEFTELKLNDGLASLRLKNKYSIYQVDTPYVSAKAVGPAGFRVGARDTVEIAVKSGSATLEGKQGKTTVNAGEFLEMRDATSPFVRASLPADDSWEQWNDERDRYYERGATEARRNLPPNISLVAPDLDPYGTWRTVPKYGSVWCPTVSPNWRPYSAGHWTWVDPFGWTWVSDEPWGWAPYHYGTWVSTGFGWAWVPGPAYQYWSPAVVNFCSFGSSICWAPLCPEEIIYPVGFSLGFRHGNWSLFFSIGSCGVFYPGYNHFWRPWNSFYVNHFHDHGRWDHPNGPRWGDGDRFHHEGHFAANHNTWGNRPWVPRNARQGGASMVSSHGFASGGHYSPVPRGNLTAFAHGRPLSAPPTGHTPMAGPATVRPTLASLSPSRTFAHTMPPASSVNRQVYRATVASQVAHNAPGIGTRTAAPTTNRTSALRQANRIPTSNPRTAGEGGIRSTSARTVPGAGVIERSSGVIARTNPMDRTAEAVRSARSSLGFGSREPGSLSRGRESNIGPRSTPSAAAHGGFSPTENAVIRARASLGLPARAGRSDGSFVGPGASIHGNSGTRTPGGFSSGERGGGFYAPRSGGGSRGSGNSGGYNGLYSPSGRSQSGNSSPGNRYNGGDYAPSPRYGGGNSGRTPGGSYSMPRNNGSGRSTGGSFGGSRSGGFNRSSGGAFGGSRGGGSNHSSGGSHGGESGRR